MLPGVLASDSDLVATLIEMEYPVHEDGTEGKDDDLERALEVVLPRLAGAFSFVLTDARHLIAVRDPNGFRPLCLGELDPLEPGGEVGYVIASESPALDIVGARFVRDIEPGEMVVVGLPTVSAARPPSRRNGSTRAFASSNTSTCPARTRAFAVGRCTPRATGWGEQCA